MFVNNLENSPKNFTLYPLLWLAVCFASGILSANFFALGWQVYLAICIISALLTAVFIKQKFAPIFLFIASAQKSRKKSSNTARILGNFVRQNILF